MIRCMIVDDEPAARALLEEFLEPVRDVEVVGSYGDPADALSAIHENPPDLLYLDIAMPRLGGFELLRAIGGGQMPAVVFVTAHDEHAVRAFDVNAVDFLLKPVSEPRLLASLERVRAALRDRRALALTGRRFAVKVGARIRIIPAEEVDAIQAHGDHVLLHCGSQTYEMRESIGKLEPTLDPARFTRVHRSFIVNIGRVTELEPMFKGEYVLVLESGRRVVTGRTFKDRIRSVFSV